MAAALMTLKILLPFRVFLEKNDVLRLVAETAEGSTGFLPHRLDCVSSLTPGILVYETKADGESYVAVDDGVLVKTGTDVCLSVRRAMEGRDPDLLREQVKKEFLTLEENEQRVRSVMAKIETGFVTRYTRFRHA